MAAKAVSDSIEAIFESQQRRSIKLREQPVSERKRLLRDFENFLLKNQDRITGAVHADFKKPLAEVCLSELYPVITEIRHAREHLDEWSAPQKIDAPITYLGTRSSVRYEPKGVCLIISPWNFPFNLCFGPLISCLAAGNTAILKPSELTPSAAQLIEDLVREFFDDDLVAVVQGDAEVSRQLLEFPFDHIFFTGSPAVGKIVMQAAAKNLTSVTLELGGKSPAIIGKNANLDDAARRIAFGKFLNNGQTCIAPDYVLAEESILSAFTEKLRRQAELLFGNSGTISETSESYARIVDQKNFDRVSRLMKDAIDRGAAPAWSGATNAATRFFHPVILTQVNSSMDVMKEEIFGPILPVMSFKIIDDAADFINSRPKPLALYIFESNTAFVESVLRKTSAGSVCINDCVIQFSHPNLPFGGIGNSGIGKSHGRHGFAAFSNEKPVVRQKRGFAALYLVYPPYTKRVKKIIDLMIRWF